MAYWTNAIQFFGTGVTSPYYKRTDGIFMCYDNSEDDTCVSLMGLVEHWYREIDRWDIADKPKMLIGTKCDKDQMIDEETIIECMKRMDICNVMKVSSRTGEGVNEAVDMFCTQLIQLSRLPYFG